MAAKWKAEAKAKYNSFANLMAKAKAVGGPPAKPKAPVAGVMAPVVGEVFANLAARADGGITTLTSGDNSGVQPPSRLPGSLMVNHGMNTMSFLGANWGQAPNPNSWVAANGGPGRPPAVMGDAQLLAACGRYVSNDPPDVNDSPLTSPP